MDDIESIQQYINDNEYDTESIIADFLFESYQPCNFRQHVKSYEQFELLQNIVSQYNTPVLKIDMKLCNKNNVFDVDKCTYIETIANALNEIDQGNDINEINVSHLLTAYDHMVSIHGLCEIKYEKKEDASKPFEEINILVNDAQKYIVDIFGYCENKMCPILHQHLSRNREQIQIPIQKHDGTNHQDLNEILNATLNALHCYILHERKELFRLHRSNSHFITAIVDVHEEKQKSDSVPSIHFGLSVLQWLDYAEQPMFSSFREEIIQNEQSTISAKIYLHLAQECYIKLSNNKHEQYLLEEIMSLKLYTDADVFQASLRQSFWKSSPKKTKLSFYNWAMLLYKTASFHNMPIMETVVQANAPKQLYHGLNRVFVLDNARPKYNAPISTSLEPAVAYSFSQGKGLLLTIKPSFTNKFEFLTGICVAWISQYKNEAEVLLMNQYLPIASAINFESDPKNNVDHLMYTVHSYKKNILDKAQFYKVLGIILNETWIPFIKNHKLLYNFTELDTKRRILDVLVEELDTIQLSIEHQQLSSTFELQKQYCSFDYCSFKIKLNHQYTTDNNDKCFQDAHYKFSVSDNDSKIKDEIHFTHTDTLILSRSQLTNTSCKIYIKNDKCFGNNQYMLLQDMDFSHVQTFIQNETNNFTRGLVMQQDKIIRLSVPASTIDENEILQCRFIVLSDIEENANQTQLTQRNVTDRKYYIYQFDDIDNIQFIVPFTRHTNVFSIYVQFDEGYNFVFLKTFHIKNTSQKNDRVEYVLQTLKIFTNPIKNAHDFFSKIGCTVSNDDVHLMSQNRLYETTSHDTSKYVIERLVKELEISKLSMELKLLTTKFEIEVYHAFGCFCPVKLVAVEQHVQRYFAGTEYKLVEQEEAKSNVCKFKHDETLIIKTDNINNKCYKIFVKNKPLQKYFFLQKIQTGNLYPFGTDWNLGCNLQLYQGKLILMDKEYQSRISVHLTHITATFPTEIQNAKFVLICNENDFGTQVYPDLIFGNHYIYTFREYKQVHFIIPFKKK
eukprot:18110_1